MAIPPRWSSATQSSLGLRVGAAIAVVTVHVAVVASFYSTQYGGVQHIEKPEAMMVHVIESSVAKGSTASPQREVSPDLTRPILESRLQPESQLEIKPQPATMVPPWSPSKPKLATPSQPRSAMSPQPSSVQAPQGLTSPSPTTETTATPQHLRTRPVAAEPVLISGVQYAGKPPQPEYPRLSRERREEGTTVVLVDIDTQGRVTQAVIDASSGYARLDQAALQAAREARFKPYTRGDTAYPSQTKLPFVFTLKRN